MELPKNTLPDEQLFRTNFELEPEEYILTEAEELVAIENELLALKRHATWKMKGLGMPDAKILDKMNEINWDERIDRNLILKRANSNKQYGIWQQQQREIDRKAEVDKQAELNRLYSAKNVYRLMQWTSQNEFGKQLILNDDNKHLIKTLCYFISRDERFETELGYSGLKGLLIRGISGLGKTHLVQCLRKNELNPVLILSMLEITGDIKADGEYEVKLGDNKIIYLDDVGTEEPIVNHFGTKISFFKTFIETYYLRHKSFGNLMISTNNSFAEIEEKYGFRVRSRMKDIFNVVDVSGNDMRG